MITVHWKNCCKLYPFCQIEIRRLETHLGQVIFPYDYPVLYIRQRIYGTIAWNGFWSNIEFLECFKEHFIDRNKVYVYVKEWFVF